MCNGRFAEDREAAARARVRLEIDRFIQWDGMPHEVFWQHHE